MQNLTHTRTHTLTLLVLNNTVPNIHCHSVNTAVHVCPQFPTDHAIYDNIMLALSPHDNFSAFAQCATERSIFPAKKLNPHVRTLVSI